MKLGGQLEQEFRLLPEGEEENVCNHQLPLSVEVGDHGGVVRGYKNGGHLEGGRTLGGPW